MNICVLIPCYNEAAAIGQLINEIKLKDLPVVVVDDGSTDNSVSLARAAGAIVLEHERNYGKGYTIQTGISYLLESNYDGALIMDGDGQHAISDIDKFLKKIQENPNRVINGNRMEAPVGMPWIRIQTNKFMSAIISWAARKKIPDTQCGYRYVGRKVFETIKLETESFEIETEILIKAAKAKFDIVSVNIQSIYGDEKSNIRPLRDTFKFLIYYFKEIFS